MADAKDDGDQSVSKAVGVNGPQGTRIADNNHNTTITNYNNNNKRKNYKMNNNKLSDEGTEAADTLYLWRTYRT